MKTAEEVYAEIILSHQALEKIPPSLHLFCPKADDDDEADYNKPNTADAAADVAEKKSRIEAAQERLQLVSWASLILGIDKEQADSWRPGWIKRTEAFLTKCDACVRHWHMNRKALENRLLKYGAGCRYPPFPSPNPSAATADGGLCPGSSTSR